MSSAVLLVDLLAPDPPTDISRQPPWLGGQAPPLRLSSSGSESTGGAQYLRSRVDTDMRNIIHVVIALPLLLAAAPAPVPSPGLWEHTIVYVVDKVNGSSLLADQGQSMLPPPPPYRACYSASDLSDPRAFLLASKSVQCHLSDFTMANGKLSASGNCTDARYPSVHVAGTGAYGATGYDFSFSGRAQAGEITVDFRGRDSGRRVGSCPASATGG
jgi:hypothetical protein